MAPNTSPVILILGAGSRVGKSVAQAFSAKGYKVALAARSLKEADSTADQVNIAVDLSDPKAVATAFSKVESALGVPSVIVYNGKVAQD
jgi:NAD(P)-dependent dehydrogenase (short-subunit alcohol dehydrogenase family)